LLHPPESYAIGEKVLLANFQRVVGLVSKWLVKWCGPYEVIDQLGPITYRIVDCRSDRNGKIKVVNVRHLKQYYDEYENEFGTEDFYHDNEVPNDIIDAHDDDSNSVVPSSTVQSSILDSGLSFCTEIDDYHDPVQYFPNTEIENPVPSPAPSITISNCNVTIRSGNPCVDSRSPSPAPSTLFVTAPSTLQSSSSESDEDPLESSPEASSSTHSNTTRTVKTKSSSGSVPSRVSTRVRSAPHRYSLSDYSRKPR